MRMQSFRFQANAKGKVIDMFEHFEFEKHLWSVFFWFLFV